MAPTLSCRWGLFTFGVPDLNAVAARPLPFLNKGPPPPPTHTHTHRDTQHDGCHYCRDRRLSLLPCRTTGRPCTRLTWWAPRHTVHQRTRLDPCPPWGASTLPPVDAWWRYAIHAVLRPRSWVRRGPRTCRLMMQPHALGRPSFCSCPQSLDRDALPRGGQGRE